MRVLGEVCACLKGEWSEGPGPYSLPMSRGPRSLYCIEPGIASTLPDTLHRHAREDGMRRVLGYKEGGVRKVQRYEERSQIEGISKEREGGTWRKRRQEKTRRNTAGVDASLRQRGF